MLAAYPQVPTGYDLGVGCAVHSYDGKLFVGLDRRYASGSGRCSPPRFPGSFVRRIVESRDIEEKAPRTESVVVKLGNSSQSRPRLSKLNQSELESREVPQGEVPALPAEHVVEAA